jgi:hypothetical protein
MPPPAPPGTSFTSADEAMDMVRAGLSFLARADAAGLPGVTQARLLRELERAESQHTAARARILFAFCAHHGYEADGQFGPRPWLVSQTRVSAKAASGAIGWMHRLSVHAYVAEALAAGRLSASYARQICAWSRLLPLSHRDAADQILVDAAIGGGDLADLARLAEEMFSRVAPPDRDEDRGFADRFFRLTRLFKGHGRADGDLTPECLAALQEVLDTLGKKAGPEDDRTAGQRRHDALEEAMRLLLASGCLPERAGQPAQVQLHMNLDELLGLPGADEAARAWLASHLGTDQPADGGSLSSDGGISPAGHPGADQHGDGTGTSKSDDGGSASGKPDLDEVLWPDPFHKLTRPDPAAARRAAAARAGAGQPGWLTGKAAEAYSCDAKIAPMVCGHLDRNLLAQAVTDLLAGDLANVMSTSDPAPAPGPRCECDEHPRTRRAPIPGALPTTGLPATKSLTPSGLARLQDTLLRYAVSMLSGPTGLAAYLRTQLTGGFFPSASLPLDLGQPTEEVPPHLRRAVIKRDRHCSFPGCSLPPVRCHVHHVIPRSKGGPTRLDNLTLLCSFHHLIAIHRRGWSLTLHGDGTTTAKSPDGIRTLHSHGPPPGQGSLWDDRPGHGPPATAA